MTDTTSFDRAFTEIMAEYKRVDPERTNFFLRLKAENRKRPIVLYGAGGNCEFAFFCCSCEGVHPSYICDASKTGVYEYCDSKYTIIPPDVLLKEYKDALILITPWRFEQEIAGDLRAMGFPAEQTHFLRSPYVVHPDVFIEKYLAGYKWAYDFFSDNNSKQKILERIRHYLLGEYVPMNSPYRDSYFGNPQLLLGKKEVFVDGGGYTGDTVQEFIQSAKEYRRIHSFEPDTDNWEEARRILAGFTNVNVINKGLWSEDTVLSFDNNRVSIGSRFMTAFDDSQTHRLTDSQTHRLTDSQTHVPVTALDCFFADAHVEDYPTLIKMDIEGSEKNALLGAGSIIRRAKPKMAICAYHKPEDIYELPKTVMGIRDDYRMSLWQIGDSFWDMILYAL